MHGAEDKRTMDAAGTKQGRDSLEYRRKPNVYAVRTLSLAIHI